MRKAAVSVLVIILLFMTTLLGCAKTEEKKETASPETSQKAQAEPVSVNIGMTKYITNSPIYIALEKGFFKEENLDVNVKWMELSQTINTAVVSGDLDVGAAGFTADLFNMIAAGQKVVIVSDKGREEKGYPFSAVVVHKDSAINSIEDLKGKRIGITQIGSTVQYTVANIIEKHGMTMKDVQWVPLNQVRSLMDALQGKNVDAIVLSEPNVSVSVTAGYGKVLAWVADEIDYQSSGIYFSPKFAANKDAGVRFLKAYIKGARYYYDAALTKKDGKIVKGANYDEVVKIISKYAGQPEELVKGSLSFIDPNGKLKIDNIQSQLDWYAKEKFINKPLNTKDFVDTQILEEALKALGEQK
jgi:NitT/TauT family transport system substrate-binding protein